MDIPEKMGPPRNSNLYEPFSLDSMTGQAILITVPGYQEDVHRLLVGFTWQYRSISPPAIAGRLGQGTDSSCWRLDSRDHKTIAGVYTLG